MIQWWLTANHARSARVVQPTATLLEPCVTAKSNQLLRFELFVSGMRNRVRFH